MLRRCWLSDAAYADFDRYEKMLPGNPNIVFYKGLSLEKSGRTRESAAEYYRYLQMDQQSDQAKYSYERLVQWGYVGR